MNDMLRFIFSIQLTLKTPSCDEVWQLIAVLDRHGQSCHCRAVMPKRRVIDMRVGDRVWFDGTQYTILNIVAFRDTCGPADLVTEIDAGYLVARPA
jgi:hypothetical protein